MRTLSQFLWLSLTALTATLSCKIPPPHSERVSAKAHRYHGLRVLGPLAREHRFEQSRRQILARAVQDARVRLAREPYRLRACWGCTAHNWALRRSDG